MHQDKFCVLFCCLSAEMPKRKLASIEDDNNIKNEKKNDSNIDNKNPKIEDIEQILLYLNN